MSVVHYILRKSIRYYKNYWESDYKNNYYGRISLRPDLNPSSRFEKKNKIYLIMFRRDYQRTRSVNRQDQLAYWGENTHEESINDINVSQGVSKFPAKVKRRGKFVISRYENLDHVEQDDNRGLHEIVLSKL